MSKKSTIAEDLDYTKILHAAIKSAEKSSKLSQAFLERDGFASSATSAGSLSLDAILGGGVPPGRIVGIVGPEHSGKSLLATEIIRHQLLSGRVAIYYDAEGGTDPLFLQSRGINLDQYRGRRTKSGELATDERDLILYYQPTTGGEVLQHMVSIMDALPESRNRAKAPPVIFVLDSVLALISDAMSEDLDANKMAMHARMYAEMLPIINGRLVKTGCSFVYVNQLRQKPGVMMGSPFYEPAGDALKFFSAIRLNLALTKPKLADGETYHPFASDSGMVPGAKPRAGGVWEEPHREKGEIEGLDRYVYTGISTVKNKVYTPKLAAWMRIQAQNGNETGRGLDPVFDIFTFLLNQRLIQKAKPKDGEKVSDVAKMFEVVKTDFFDPDKYGMPSRFDYYVFKDYVDSQDTIKLFLKLREDLIESNAIFTKGASDANKS